MATLIVLSVVAAAIAGFAVKYTLDVLDRKLQITWRELSIGLALTSIVVAPLAGWAGWSIARGSLLSFRAYRNGWELEAMEEIIPCELNGDCRYTYECHCRMVCTLESANGDCLRREEACDACPYFTFERDLTIRTTVGDYAIARLAPRDYLAERRTLDLPPDFGPEDYVVPQVWLDCQRRVENGRPGPVTRRVSYDNYILASDRTILKQHSGMIDQYREAGLLPPVHRAVHDHYYANKASFVGHRPADEEAWQSALMHLNAALGHERGGDLHLVILRDATGLIEPDAYVLALKAYWQNPEVWGDDCLAQNGIVVVIGTTDGESVAWARAQTGMPLGNEHLLVAVRDRLRGVPLSPESVVGRVRGVFPAGGESDDLKVRGTGESGVLRRILWGFDDAETGFVPVSMTGNEADGVGSGFRYLDAEIQPKPGQRWAIVIVSFILTGLVWVVFAVIGEKRKEGLWKAQ